MPVLSARNLSKSFGSRTLFEDLSLTVRRGERVGVLGRNGAGKSSLLKVMAGVDVADAGVVERRRDAKVLYLHQEPVLDPDKTAREVVAEGLGEWSVAMDRYRELTEQLGRSSDARLLEEHAALAERIETLGGWAREHEADDFLKRLGVRELDRPVGTFSGGEKRRVALARLLVERPDLAILDEPTNHLDVDTIAWLEDHLANDFPGAVLLVTHDRYVLEAVAQRIVELDHGVLTEYQGNYGDFLEAKAERLAHADRVEQNRQNLLRRETAWLRRGAQARSTKQKARIQRAEALIADKPQAAHRDMDLGELSQTAPRLGKTVLELRHVTVQVPRNPGESLDEDPRTLVHDFSMILQSGERIGIVGKNGAGKTTLLDVADGSRQPQAGEVIHGVHTKSVLFDQTRSGLDESLSVYDNAAGREGAERTGGGVVKLGDRELTLMQYLELFLFDGSAQRQKVGSLSGGERARVALAKALRSGPNLLLLDEPTNDLDVATLGALEELLADWPGAVIVVSHDRFFLDRVATSILSFEEGGRIERHAGNYANYFAAKTEAAQAAREGTAAPKVAAEPSAEEAPAPKAAPAAATPALRPLTYAERIELDGMLEAIDQAETTVNELEAKAADPALYSQDPAEAARVHTALGTAHEQLAAKMARWEDLEARRDVKR